MKLIDADTLKEEIEYYIQEAGWDEAHNEALEWCLEFIDNQTTIEPERKKGKWVLVTDSNGQHCVCDHCGEWKYHQEQKFCGECGADMREEGEHGRSDQDREDMIRRVNSICDDARLGYEVSTYNNCNNCGRKECQFKPEWGETIWWKCPLWKEGELE